MTSSVFLRFPVLGSAVALVSALCLVPAHAERADRLKKMEVESDQPGKVDLQKQQVVFNGNVVVTKGTLMIRAARIEVRETNGYQFAVATGSASNLARFRQKREGVNEFIEGEAERLEYDARTDTVRFIDKAQVKRLRGTEIADEAHGALIVYDNAAETFTVAGGAKAATPTNPNGRVLVVLSPREPSEATPPSVPASGATR